MKRTHNIITTIAVLLLLACLTASTQVFCPGRPGNSSCQYVDSPPCNVLSEACEWPGSAGVIKKNCIQEPDYYFGGCDTNYAGSEEACTQQVDSYLDCTHLRACCDGNGNAVSNFIIWMPTVTITSTYSWDSSPCTSAPLN